MRSALLSFGCGFVFAAGLCISGMTRPSKVLGFLDVAHHWDPSLLLVMVSAIAVTGLAWWLSSRQRAPWLGGVRPEPAGRTIDTRLVLGSAIFGIGWGLAGYCPGPAVVVIGRGLASPLVFFAAMLLGMKGFEWATRESRDEASSPASSPAHLEAAGRATT